MSTKTVAIRFVQIVGSNHKIDGEPVGLAALDSEGRVFRYCDGYGDGEEGWVQLAFDDKRTLIDEKSKDEEKDE